jgi:hypothetical protein
LRLLLLELPLRPLEMFHDVPGKPFLPIAHCCGMALCGGACSKLFTANLISNSRACSGVSKGIRVR